MIGGSMFPAIGALPYPAHAAAVRLLLVHARGRSRNCRTWHVAAPEALPDYMTLVVRKDIDELDQRTSPGSTLENDILPSYLQKRRWFSPEGRQGRRPVQASRSAIGDCRATAGRWCMVEIETRGRPQRATVERYQLPFGFYRRRTSTTVGAAAATRAGPGAARSSGRFPDGRLRVERVRASHRRSMLCQQHADRRAPEGVDASSTRRRCSQEVMPALIENRAGARWRALAVGRAEQQLARDRRRGGAQGYPPRGVRHQPRSRDHAPADRARLQANTSPLLGEVVARRRTTARRTC